MKVISFNVGYFLGYQSQREWVRRPHRLLLGDQDVERDCMNALLSFLAREAPDVVALQEVDLGSIRSCFTNQFTAIARAFETVGLDYEHRADVKYGRDRLVAMLPVLRNMSNAIFCSEGSTDARYLSNGTKRLVHICDRADGPTVLSVHLSKTANTRAKQLRELATMISERDEVVLTGDFNVKDRSEFDVLTDRVGGELHVPGQSFSTARPAYEFDVFFTTAGLSVGRCEVVDDVTLSDHMPVVAEVSRT